MFADPARLAGERQCEMVAIGLNELSASLGVPGQGGHPAVTELVDRAVPVWREAGIVIKGAAQSVEGAVALIERGFSVVAMPLAPFFERTMTDAVHRLAGA